MKLERNPSTALYPIPVVLITAEDNIITIAWIGTACHDPPMVSAAIRPTRHSHELIKKSGEFVVNIPTKEILEEVDYCGTISGRDVNKFAETGLTKEKAKKLSAPLIEECPVNIECTLEKMVSLGTHDLVIGRIVAVNVDEALVENGKVDYNKADLVCYVNGEYHSIGDIIGTHGFSKKQ